MVTCGVKQSMEHLQEIVCALADTNGFVFLLVICHVVLVRHIILLQSNFSKKLSQKIRTIRLGRKSQLRRLLPYPIEGNELYYVHYALNDCGLTHISLA